MRTWGTGPFDNDDAADFRGDLDHLDAPGRIKAIHGALEEAAQETGYLEALPIAVAAAALVAAQFPCGEPVSAEYGPDEAVPPHPAELHRLARARP